MKKKTSIGLLLTVFTLGIAAITAFGLADFNAEQEMTGLTYVLPPAHQTVSAAGQVAGVAIERATVSIYRGSSGTTLSAQVAIPDNGTILDALTEAAKAYNLTLDIKSFGDAGQYVNGIGDQIGGQDSQYWLYYVNGQSGTVAVDKQLVQSGDKIDFKFEKSKL